MTISGLHARPPTRPFALFMPRSPCARLPVAHIGHFESAGGRPLTMADMDSRRAQLKWLEEKASAMEHPSYDSDEPISKHVGKPVGNPVGQPNAGHRRSGTCVALTAGLLLSCIMLFFVTRIHTDVHLVTVSTDTSPGSNVRRRAPTAIATSGGGFRAMAASMSVARALAMDGHWDKITHMSSVSGGTWFSAQMAYSEWFHRNVMDLRVDLEDVVRLWGEQYANALSDTGTLGLVRDMLADARAGKSQQTCPTGNSNISVDAYLNIAVAALLDLSVREFAHVFLSMPKISQSQLCAPCQALYTCRPAL